MKHYTEVGRPPVEKQDVNCPHCNSKPVLGGSWQCSSTQNFQSRTCRIFQLEAIVDAIDELRADDYVTLHSGTPCEYKANRGETCEVSASWTSGDSEWFYGHTMAEALGTALKAKVAIEAAKEK